MNDFTDIRNIVGTEKVNFEKNGKQIKGTRFYTLEDIPANRGTGKKADKIFLSESKLAMLDFKPDVGQNIKVYYNRYGNISHISITETDDLIDLG